MASGHQTRSALVQNAALVPASQTLATVANLGISHENSRNIRIDYYLGKVVGTPSLLLQDTNGLGFWNTAKTSVLSASTQITVTPAFASGIFTATAHGLQNGQLVGLNSSGLVPGNLSSFTKYFVTNAATDTFQLATSIGGIPVSFADNGTGTVTVTAASLVSISLNIEITGDQAVLPLRPTARVAATTGSGQTVQLLDVRYGNSY